MLIIVTSIISFAVIDRLKSKHSAINVSFLKSLFYYHFLLSFAYYLYGIFNRSDSIFYYEKVVRNYRGDSWWDFYGTSTTFIEFVGYPFIKYFNFSYEAVMVVFSFMGFLGFVYFYLFFKENIRFKHSIFGYDLIKVIFLLPNLHFWSSSFGKGSIIFFGIGLFFFGLSKIHNRMAAVIIGGLIIYHVRPHIMLVLLVSSAIGFVFSSKGISVTLRILFAMGACAVFFFIYQDVLELVGLNEDEFLSEGLDMTHRVTKLSNATSGIDITTYSLPTQVLTFLYRPLFFDAPGVLGWIVSFENVFYVLITLKLLVSNQGFTYLFRANFLGKTAFFSFITVAIALSQVSGNLGLAIRQKSQVMILLMFFIVSYFDAEKNNILKIQLRRKERRIKNAISSTTTV